MLCSVSGVILVALWCGGYCFPPGIRTITNSGLNGQVLGAGSAILSSGAVDKWQS